MSGIAQAARLVVLLPALAALCGLLLPRGERAGQAIIAVVGTGAALVAAISELVQVRDGGFAVAVPLLPPVPTGAGTIELAVRADALSAVVAVMVTTVALCVQVYSIAYQAKDPRYRAFASTVSLFTAAMLVVVQSDDLVLLLIGWEVMGLCSYLLVGHESERQAARAAAVKAFLVTRFGDIGFVLGIIVLWVASGTTSISVLLRPRELASIGTTTLTVATLLLVVGVIGKSAQFPLHTWLPDAMEGPTPVSALIHAATMVAAGGVVLARLLPMLLAAPDTRATLAVVTAVTMLGAALIACVQTDLKRVLAWSTISQVAYILAAIAVTTPELGPAPSLVHLLSHAGFKALLFLSAGALAHQVHSTALGDLAGAGRRSPLVAVLFTLGLASLAGVPPLSGYWSKEAVLGAAEEGIHGAQPWTGVLVLVVGLVTGLVTAAYCARAWWLVVRDTPAEAHQEMAEVAEADLAEDSGATAVAAAEAGAVPVVPVPAAMTGVLLVLAVPTVAGGLLLLAPIIPGTVHLGPVTALVGALASIAGVAGTVALAARVGDPASVLPAWVQRVLTAGFGVDAAQSRLVVRPVRALARLVTAGDQDVVDAYVRGSATSSRWAGIALRRTQTGVTTGYLTWLVAGALVAVVVGVGLR
ncbi:NADH-quinone oxidoreductase subunit L [Angustibacter sp. McL0619]|uniref:NADH-quinone oxidoreductase subunit 5 family protein n=1 Tax=Angustibacter sp. McL0619 TaxID=3415676 RepID=UPI003CE9DEB0